MKLLSIEIFSYIFCNTLNDRCVTKHVFITEDTGGKRQTHCNIRTRTCVGVEMLQVLQVCKFAFRFSVFSCFPSAVFVCVPSFFRPYTRVRIL